MEQSLLKQCERIFEGRFDTLLQENFKTKVRYEGGKTLVEVPVIGNWCLIEEIAAFKPIACRALVAHLRFEWEKPSWVPSLPTHVEDIKEMKGSYYQQGLVGLYADSRAAIAWEPHPSFAEYCAGIRALPPANKGVILLRDAGVEIAPKPLDGLNPETLR